MVETVMNTAVMKAVVVGFVVMVIAGTGRCPGIASGSGGGGGGCGGRGGGAGAGSGVDG